jgi:Uncharacterised nucleotidyltransferase
MSPSFAHRTLLAAARGELDPARIAAIDADRRADLLRRSRDHGMMGLVARAVRQLPSVEPWAVAILQQAIGIRQAHAMHLRTLEAAATSLRSADVPLLIVKGPSLVERYYHDDSLRPYGDVDILVPTDRFGIALSALERRGFPLLDRNWNLLRRDLRGQLHLGGPHAERDLLELHWHPVNPRRVRNALSVHAEDLLDGSMLRSLGEAEVLVPRPSRELGHLCLHAALHGCDRLIWLVDIALVMGAQGLDLDDLVRTARRWGFGAGTYMVLTLVDRWIGLPRPLTDLAALRPDRATFATFERLVSRWDLGHPGRDARFRQLLFATAGDGLGRRARLAWSLVVPPDVSDPSRETPDIRAQLRRTTLGSVTRIRHKLDEHAHDIQALEYQASGDPKRDLPLYLSQVREQAAVAGS